VTDADGSTKDQDGDKAAEDGDLSVVEGLVELPAARQHSVPPVVGFR
jgi:hypothetical protein